MLIPTTGLVTARDIQAAEDLRLVAQPAAGYNNIDVEAARARGVPVTIAPGGHRVRVVPVIRGRRSRLLGLGRMHPRSASTHVMPCAHILSCQVLMSCHAMSGLLPAFGVSITLRGLIGSVISNAGVHVLDVRQATTLGRWRR